MVECEAGRHWQVIGFKKEIEDWIDTNMEIKPSITINGKHISIRFYTDRDVVLFKLFHS